MFPIQNFKRYNICITGSNGTELLLLSLVFKSHKQLVPLTGLKPFYSVISCHAICHHNYSLVLLLESPFFYFFVCFKLQLQSKLFFFAFTALQTLSPIVDSLVGTPAPAYTHSRLLDYYSEVWI